MSRHFYRCVDCLDLTVIDGQQQHEILCDCGARLNYMGHVNGDTLRIDAERSACDDRCTSATGPNCDCGCGGVNHGTNRVVQVQIITGNVPQVTARANLATRCAQVAAWRRAILEARERADAATHGTISAMQRGQRIKDKALWWQARDYQAAIRKASDYQSHKRRMSALAAIAQTAQAAA